MYIIFQNGVSTGHYVSKVEEVMGDGLQVTFLQAVGKDRKTFAYPHIQDKSLVTLKEVECKLLVPQMDSCRR